MNREEAIRLLNLNSRIEVSVDDPYYYLNIAEAVAEKSKDPSSQVGAVLVAPDNRQIVTGYNGFAAAVGDYKDLLDKTVTEPLSKYDLVIHAEMNAILNCPVRPENWVLYCTMLPCAECAKMITASGISHVTCLSNAPKSEMGCSKSEHILALAGVGLEILPPLSVRVRLGSD